MSTIKINILEVASELAHKKVEEKLEYRAENIYEWVSDEESKYTEQAQDIFDNNYDEFYNFLWNLKEE